LKQLEREHVRTERKNCFNFLYNPHNKRIHHTKAEQTMPTSIEHEKDALLQAAKLMLLSARTAPKSGGIDDIQTQLISGQQKNALVTEMQKIAEERPNAAALFKRDAKNVQDSETVILIGVRGTKKFGLDCGGCGYKNCTEYDKAPKQLGQDFIGPNCIFKLLDLGIALGSAAKTASILNVDNRIMYRVGTAAKRLDHMPDASIVMGIPISAKGKSIYYDRK
jgi:uncharacterized ferredoxin-like protein